MKPTHFASLFALVAAAGASSRIIIDSIPLSRQGLEDTDCQLRCPQSSYPGRLVLPAITQFKNGAGEWENTLECWEIDNISTDVEGIDNAFRLDWEGGFDAAYQHVFYDQSFMPAHPAPEPSLIVMSSGIGKS